jgi:predicted metal-binding protein
MSGLENEKEPMNTREKIEQLAKKHEVKDYKWLDPKSIVVEQWVRMKCMYGCSEYGRTATCPPSAPSITECEKFFKEYMSALVIHFEKSVEKPEDRHAWTKNINSQLLELERDVFISGYRKAFLLFLDTCTLCDGCPGKREKCKEPKKARPTPEALGVDVYATVRKIGYPIEVLSDYSQTMNRYAFLLIE